MYKTFAKYQLTDIPMDIMKEIHINPKKLQTFGQTLDKLNDIDDGISEHKRAIT